jgi:hypothetical protein
MTAPQLAKTTSAQAEAKASTRAMRAVTNLRRNSSLLAGLSCYLA